MGVGSQGQALAALPPAKRTGTHCTGSWVDPNAGLEVAENLAHAGIRYPDRPACSESLLKYMVRFA